MSTSPGARASATDEEFLGALYKGGELLAAGNLAEARQHLERAYELVPRNEKAQNLLGLTYFKLGEYTHAAGIYEKLVNDNPVDPTLRVNLGLVYLKTNDLGRCIKEFETATDLDPEHKKAHNYLGLALAQAGQYARAREHFVQAGSDAMAEKMARALVAQVDAAPKTIAIEPPPSAPPPPLPPPPDPMPSGSADAPFVDDDAIEVMSDEELPPDADSAPVEAEVQEVEVQDVEVQDVEVQDVEVEEAPPESAPRPRASPSLSSDWGAQFGMDEPPAPAASPQVRMAEDEGPSSTDSLQVTVDEMPMVDAVMESPPAADPAFAVTTTESHWGESPAGDTGAGYETALPHAQDTGYEETESNVYEASAAAAELDQVAQVAPVEPVGYEEPMPGMDAASAETPADGSMQTEAAPAWLTQEQGQDAAPAAEPEGQWAAEAAPEPEGQWAPEAPPSAPDPVAGWTEESLAPPPAGNVHTVTTAEVKAAPPPPAVDVNVDSTEPSTERQVAAVSRAREAAAEAPDELPQSYRPMGTERLVDIGASSQLADLGPGPFHQGPDGLAVTVNGEMLVRLEGLVAIVGSLEVVPESKRTRGRPTGEPFGADALQLQRVSGHGTLYLEPGRRSFHAFDLDDEGAYLREERVFAFEEVIAFENGRLTGENATSMNMVHLKGRGRVLLQLDGPLKAMPVPAGSPMVVPLTRLVGWFGIVTPRLKGFAGQGAVELTGDGYALLSTVSGKG